MAEIILQNPWALLALPLLWLLLLAFAWRRRFKPFGAFLLRLAILVLVNIGLISPGFCAPGSGLGRRKSRAAGVAGRPIGQLGRGGPASTPGRSRAFSPSVTHTP